MRRYELIFGDNLVDFLERVNAVLATGGELQGGVSASTHPMFGFQYYQAVVVETSAQQGNAAELLPPVVRDVDDDAWIKGTQIP